MAGAVSGCAVTGSAITYRYDNFNRLISYENGSITAQYAYDGEDYRIRKTVSDAAGTKETRYFYEGNQVAYEADASGNLTAHNVYGTTLISQTGEADNSIRYAGYQYDLETGLYYVNARYYNSTTGRFITEDTYIGKYYDPLSLNRYTYCHNNPLRYTDPSGHGLFSSLALKFLGGAVFGAVAEVVSQKLFEKKEKIDWKAVAYEAVVGGVSAAVGGVIGKKLASKTTGSATKKIVKSAVAAGVSESSSGFATDVGKQIFVEDKKLDEVDYGQAAKTASIAGIAGIAGAILGAYKECISGYRLETKQRKVKRYSVRYQCFNAIENCPNHPNYPVVTGVREQMETYQEWVYVGKKYADDLADSAKKGITKAAKSTDTVKKAAEKKAASTIQDGAAETVTKKESLLDRVKKWWKESTKESGEKNKSRKADFYVTSKGDVVPSTGYRYCSANNLAVQTAKDGYIEATNKGMYFSFDKIDDSIIAQGKLRIPYRPEYRISFDTLDIIDDIHIPKGDWGKADYLEPITKDFKKFGPGKATQAITYSTINFIIEIFKLR